MDLALFDFDGTITVSDTWAPFVRFATPRARLALGQVLLSPVAIGYRVGLISASRGRQMVARMAFRDERAQRVRQLGREYATTVIPAVVRPAALERIEWHRTKGDHVVVVSASLDVYIRPWCEDRGIEFICTTLEEHAGRLTGRYVEGDCCGEEKTRRIRQRYELGRYEVIYAYGDSGEDRQMLALAHKKYYQWQEIS